jgi:hypothetical protein
MNFEIISEITDVRTIFVGSRIRDLARLRKCMERPLAKGKRSGDGEATKW